MREPESPLWASGLQVETKRATSGQTACADFAVPGTSAVADSCLKSAGTVSQAQLLNSKANFREPAMIYIAALGFEGKEVGRASP